MTNKKINEELAKNIRNLALTKQLNILIGSGRARIKNGEAKLKEIL